MTWPTGKKGGAHASLWVALGSSAILSASWVVYWLYLLNTEITRQSVYLGEITFYSAMLLAVSCCSVVTMGISLGVMSMTRGAMLKQALLWAIVSLSLAVLMFMVTRGLIAGAT